MKNKPNLGKLIAVHGPSPASLQRAAVVALVSFAFFLTMLLVFYMRQQIGYFILATAFLVVNIFTMIGWLMQRRNVVQVFENGISYRKDKFRWEEITGMVSNDSGLEISALNGSKLKVPKSIDALDRVADTINFHALKTLK